MQLVDLKTLSDQISISVFTLRKYVKMGMPHYRVGRKILVEQTDFKAWFQQFKAGSETAENHLCRLVETTLQKISQHTLEKIA